MRKFLRIAQFFKSQKAAASGCYGIGNFLPDVISGNSDRYLNLRSSLRLLRKTVHSVFVC